MTIHEWTKPQTKKELYEELKKVNNRLTKLELRKQSITDQLSEI